MEWARTHGFEADLVDQLSAEPRSTVTFDLHTEGDVVKLTLTHTFGPAKTLREMCSQGWPRLLADLKTLLETGDLANEVRTT